MTTTISTLQNFKLEGHKFSCLTSYDATFAACADEAGIDVLLVGDTLGMVIQGHTSTIPVSLDDMTYHTQAVAKGSSKALIMADMPFMTAKSIESCMNAAQKLMQAGAHIIKLEGSTWLCPLIEKLKQQGVPVCAHIGLTPQSVNTLGGFKTQATDADAADALIKTAIDLEKAGADIILVECIPAPVTERLSQNLKVPTIGIGAGPACDGQILVVYDMLGIPTGRKPRFAKNYLAENNSIVGAMKQFNTEVKSGTYPELQHGFR